tara:strand:- start:849 stop:1043 length:195 start_codon:yes stop_codon:yes gene_type:complete
VLERDFDKLSSLELDFEAEEEIGRTFFSFFSLCFSTPGVEEEATRCFGVATSSKISAARASCAI